MTAGFIIWSIVYAVLLGIGVWAWKADQPVGFYTGVKPPEVDDVRKYNHSVAFLWFGYAVLFELTGLPLLFLKQNAAGILLCVLGVAAITILLMISYNRILARHEKKQALHSK